MSYAKIIGDLKLLEIDAGNSSNPVMARVFRGLWLELQSVNEDERVKRDQVYAAEVKTLTANAQRIRELESELKTTKDILERVKQQEIDTQKKVVAKESALAILTNELNNIYAKRNQRRESRRELRKKKQEGARA